MIGAFTFIAFDNSSLPVANGWGSLMDDFTTIPIQIYN
jgi:hypothetical protein